MIFMKWAGMMKSKRGFTLIELLISFVILSMLLTVATTTYQLLVSRWEKNSTAFEEAYQVYRDQELLQNILANTYPYVVVDKNEPSFFFVGSESSILAVTRKGVFDRDYPEIYKLSVITEPSGKQKLLYQAKSFNHLLLNSPNQEIVFDQQIELFAQADRIQFRYYGQESIFTATSENVVNATWYERYSGLSRMLFPIKIAYEIEAGEQQLKFQAAFHEDSFKELSRYVVDEQ